jgi:uncharacterized glyoxalase superfamily protein PhnB
MSNQTLFPCITFKDAKASIEWLERALAAERDSGTLVVVSSHAPEQAERLGARRIRLAGGRVARPATP